ncbi:hypothetical protein F4604DRAFT_1991921 [Suillus subluteus]|nr:hypothetical protein F4604DRAFT_1991921 [Suillus subluteus]
MSINPANAPIAAIPPISLECCMFMLRLNSPLPLNSPHPSLCPPTSLPARPLVRSLPIFFRARQYVDLNGNSGKPMAKHPSCSFYRWFPQLLAFPSIINLIRSSSPSLNYSPTFTSSQPATSTPSSSEATMFPFPSTQPHMKPNGKKPRKWGEKCVGSFCQRPRALQCTRAMCLTHCTNAGGCAIHPVDTEIVYDYEGMGAEEEFELLADEQADMAPLEPGVDSGDTGHETLCQALAMPLAMCGLEFPVVPPPHIPSFHDLLTAPVINTPSLTAPPPTALITTPAPVKKPPCITQQLDPLWVSDLNACAQREAEEQRIAEHWKEMEKAVKQRFVLHWYDANNAPVVEEWVTDCPFYPQFQLADDPALIDSLGEEINKIETTLSSRVHHQPDLDDFDARRASSMSPTPLSAPRTTLSSHLASTKASHTTEPLIIEVFVPAYNSTKRVWPQGMYTTDMVTGFQQMDDKNLRARFQQDDLFRCIFSVPFVKATYHDNCRAWQKTDPAILASYEAAGQTANGLWSHYLAAHREVLGEKTKKPTRRAK